MNAILDQQHEFQMKQAANSNMRSGRERRVMRCLEVSSMFGNQFVKPDSKCGCGWRICRRSGRDRRAILSTLEREMLLCSQ